jgi:hypothetical protein
MGFAERRAEGIWARRFARQSIQRAGCFASYDKALLVTRGKLKSTDGTYGLRFAHNTDAVVTGLTITKN